MNRENVRLPHDAADVYRYRSGVDISDLPIYMADAVDRGIAPREVYEPTPYEYEEGYDADVARIRIERADMVRANTGEVLTFLDDVPADWITSYGLDKRTTLANLALGMYNLNPRDRSVCLEGLADAVEDICRIFELPSYKLWCKERGVEAKESQEESYASER